MKSFFDPQTGLICLDELVYAKESFQTVVLDGIVTDDEMKKQSDTVIHLLKRMEDELSHDQCTLVMDALSELAVLYQINAMREGEV